MRRMSAIQCDCHTYGATITVDAVREHSWVLIVASLHIIVLISLDCRNMHCTCVNLSVCCPYIVPIYCNYFLNHTIRCYYSSFALTYLDFYKFLLVEEGLEARCDWLYWTLPKSIYLFIVSSQCYRMCACVYDVYSFVRFGMCVEYLGCWVNVRCALWTAWLFI